MRVLAIFGPTAVGKTGVAIELAEILRGRGEDPVAVNCDSIQVYRGLEVLSGAADAAERERLEHRLLSFVDPAEEFSAGRYAGLAHAEIDGLLADGRRPLIVGGTGLYLRAALRLDLRLPRRSAPSRRTWRTGAEALHAELLEPLRVHRTIASESSA
jgi:tRNA dimethylallyltransferase